MKSDNCAGSCRVTILPSTAADKKLSRARPFVLKQPRQIATIHRYSQIFTDIHSTIHLTQQLTSNLTERFAKDVQIFKSSQTRLLSSNLLLILSRLGHLDIARQQNDCPGQWTRSLQRTGHITHLKASPALHLVILWACATVEGSELFAPFETHVLQRMILNVYVWLYIVVSRLYHSH